MSKLKQFLSRKSDLSSGFTLVEVLAIAPILILAISGFVVLIVAITGDVLKSNAGNQAAYDTQAAVDMFEQDARLATQFLTTSTTLSSPQGYNSSDSSVNAQTTSTTFPLNNPSGTPNTRVLAIMNMAATNKNPLDPTRELIYNRGILANCNTPAEYKQNDPYMINIIYFYTEEAGSKTLWRRTVFNNAYDANNVCGGPIWQLRSCTPGRTDTVCGTEDVRVLSNIDTIEATYFQDHGFSTPATYTGIPVDGVGVELNITVNQKVAGAEIKRNGVIRATRVGSTVTPSAPAAIVSHPANVFTSTGRTAVFSVAPSDALAQVKWQWSNTGSSTWADIGRTGVTLSIQDVKQAWNGRKYRAVLTTESGTITSNPATLTVSTLPQQLPLSSGYSHYGGGFSTPTYTKTSAGVVVLKGLVRRGPNAATPQYTLIGTLPEGLRPSANLLFQTMTYPAAASRVDVYPDGSVYAMIANDDWVLLDGIKFISAPSSALIGHPSENMTFTNATFANSWQNYGSGWQTMQFGIDSLNRTHLRGLVRYGTVADGTQIISNLPAARRSGQYLHLPAWTAGPTGADGYGTFGLTQSSATQAVVAKGRGNGFLPINAMFYPSSHSGWSNIALQSGWVNYGGDFSTAQYTKAADGIVTLKGLIRGGSTLIGTLPGTSTNCFRPSERVIIASPSVNAAGTVPTQGRVDIWPDGRVEFYAGTNTWISLDNINFIADGC